MKDFSNAAFAPDTISLMQRALEGAVAKLPQPPNSSHVQTLAESILRSTREGERDRAALTTLALLELGLTTDT